MEADNEIRGAWLGSQSEKECDLLILLPHPSYCCKKLSKAIELIIGKKGFDSENSWCAFHWFEMLYMLPEGIKGLHLFVYGSVDELRAVESDSVYSSFMKAVSCKDSITTSSHKRSCVLRDVWRLRMNLVEYLLNQGEFKARSLKMLEKTIEYTCRSYGFWGEDLNNLDGARVVDDAQNRIDLLLNTVREIQYS